jgi:putative acetyltransferase
MKIQKLTVENRPRVYALLRSAFPYSDYEANLVEKLHENNRILHEWICIHTSKVIAYIAFTNAYNGSEICGLHLAPMAVAADFQGRGVGAELLRFALRQEAIKSRPLFVHGKPGYFSRFGFEPCSMPLCPYDKNNAHFLSMRHQSEARFIVGYEPEFKPATRPAATKGGKRRQR